MVPDDDEYVRILAKQVASLTIRSNWEGDQDERTDRAERCLEGYLATDWEGCVDCDEVKDCIETDEGVQDAIEDIIARNQPFPMEFPAGEMLPDSYRNQDLTTQYNPTCNLDTLFAQCYAIVDLIDASIVDVNQKLETATNVGELAKNIISTVPVLSGAVKFIGIDGALDLLNYFQEVVSEGYDAQYTTTPGGTRDQIACAIFCACKHDCTITVNRIKDVLSDRLAVYQSPPSLTGFIDLVETLAGINVDTTYVVDSAFYAAIGLMITGNYLFGGVADNVIDLVIGLAKDEKSNDWILLCECPDYWTYTLDSATDPAFVEVPDPAIGAGVIAGTVLSETSVVIFSQDVTGISGIITFPSVQDIVSFYVKQTAGTGIEGSTVVNTFVAYFDSSDALITGSGMALPVQNGEWEASASVVFSGVKYIRFQYLFLGNTQAMEWEPVTIVGYGTNPFV